jgi:hypothetical protein
VNNASTILLLLIALCDKLFLLRIMLLLISNVLILLILAWNNGAYDLGGSRSGLVRDRISGLTLQPPSNPCKDQQQSDRLIRTAPK